MREEVQGDTYREEEEEGVSGREVVSQEARGSGIMGREGGG